MRGKLKDQHESPEDGTNTMEGGEETSEKPGPWVYCMNHRMKPHLNKEIMWDHLSCVFHDLSVFKSNFLSLVTKYVSLK